MLYVNYIYNRLKCCHLGGILPINFVVKQHDSPSTGLALILVQTSILSVLIHTDFSVKLLNYWEHFD